MMRSGKVLLAASLLAPSILAYATSSTVRGSTVYAAGVGAEARPPDFSAVEADASAPDGAAQDGPIYEIRNYHFDPDRFEEYAEVARGAYLSYLRENLDVVGFWIGTDIPAEVRGEAQDGLGPANVTWIIRWSSKAERDENLPRVLGTPEWREIFADVPGGGASYLRIESRFMESLLE